MAAFRTNEIAVIAATPSKAAVATIHLIIAFALSWLSVRLRGCDVETHFDFSEANVDRAQSRALLNDELLEPCNPRFHFSIIGWTSPTRNWVSRWAVLTIFEKLFDAHAVTPSFLSFTRGSSWKRFEPVA